MTALAVFQLVEKRKLRLDDTVACSLPEFPFPDITLRNLLSNTSGLPNTEELFDPLIAHAPQRVIRDADVLPALRALNKRHFMPGDRFEYSNTNYNVLALLIAKISGTAFADYMQQHIFSRADMSATFVQPVGYITTTRNKLWNTRIPGLTRAAWYPSPRRPHCKSGRRTS